MYRVENGRARDLAALLNETLGTGTSASARRRAVGDVAPGRDIVALEQRPRAPQRAAAFRSRSRWRTGPAGAGAAGQQQSRRAARPAARRQARPAAGRCAPDIRITADEVNNLLLIHASPSDYRRISTVLRADRPSAPAGHDQCDHRRSDA